MYILKKKLVHVNSNRLTVKMEGCVADCVCVMGGGLIVIDLIFKCIFQAKSQFSIKND